MIARPSILLILTVSSSLAGPLVVGRASSTSRRAVGENDFAPWTVNARVTPKVFTSINAKEPFHEVARHKAVHQVMPYIKVKPKVTPADLDAMPKVKPKVTPADLDAMPKVNLDFKGLIHEVRAAHEIKPADVLAMLKVRVKRKVASRPKDADLQTPSPGNDVFQIARRRIRMRRLLGLRQEKRKKPVTYSSGYVDYYVPVGVGLVGFH